MESELSAKYFTHSDEKNERLVGRKRNSKNLKENYLFRRVLNGKTLGRYEEMANSYYNLMAFNWEDERLVKYRGSTIKKEQEENYIQGREAKNDEIELKNKLEVDQNFGPIWDSKIEQNKNEDKPLLSEPIQSIDSYIDKMETCLTLLNNRNNSLFKSLTNKLKESENKFSLFNGREYNYNPDDILNDLKYTNIFSKKFQNYLINNHEDKVYINSSSFPENGKKLNSCILSRQEEEELNNNPDDIVCVICNDGDYEDDDLIVYCSSCQMTVHQSCYGIVVLPNDDWICHPCIAYGVENSKLISCACCPVKGGAMKPSALKKSSSFYSFINNLKKIDENESTPSLKFKNTVSKINMLNFNCVTESKNIQIKNPKCFSVSTQENLKENNESQNLFFSVVSDKDHEELKLNKNNNNLTLNENKGVNVITNYFNENLKSIIEKEKDFSDINSTVINETESKKTLPSIMNSNKRKRGRQKKTAKNKNKKKDKKKETSQSNEKLSDDLVANCKAFNENAWIHLSCSLWTPEIVIQDFARKDEIKNIESIDKKRFLEKCFICGFSSQGPTVKCENEKCNLRFHVECARINKYQLEMVNNSTGDLKFYIYCQNHRPHRLIKNIELRRHRSIDDIETFQKVLEKNYDILNNYDKRNEFTVFVSRKTGGISDETGAKRQIFENQTRQRVRFLSKKMKAKLINAIRDLARKICNVNIVVKKLKISHASNGIKDNNHQVNIEQSVNNMDNNMQTDENLQKLDDMHQISEYDYSIKINKEKINLSYYDTLNPSVFPWYMLKGFSNLSPYDLYKIYSTELVTDESNYSKLILKKNFTAKKKKLSKKKKLRGIAAISIKSAVNNVVQPEETPSDEIFCYCKKPCMACKYGEDGENKCVHNGWVHQECVEELREVTRETIESDDFVFVCRECIEKYETI